MNNEVLLKRDIATLKMQQAESVVLLKQCSKQVGMMLGESILGHIAELEGTHFNSKEYHMERLPGEQ
jgi:hypothetical protein